MPTTNYTLLGATSTASDGPEAASVSALVSGGGVYLAQPAFAQATGYTLKPEGFCKDAICVPAGIAPRDDGLVDLQHFASLTSRPLVVDETESVICLGAEAAARGDLMTSLQAPNFSLPDLTGTQHRLSDYRGKKVLLAAYASW